MKVALCANTSWYLFNFRKNLITALQYAGHEVYAISPFDAHVAKLQRLGVRWMRLRAHQTSRNPVTEIRTVLHLAFLLTRLQPDVVLTFTVKGNLYAGLVRKIRKFRQLANISGLGESFDRSNGLTRFVVAHLYRSALKHVQQVFFQNHEDLWLFVRYNILPEHLCERIPGSGVDLSTFTPCLARKGKETPRVFLMFGRILPAKGYDLFLEVARTVRLRRQDQAEFWILGIRDSSRTASIRLFEKILDFHAQGIVSYYPPTDDVVPIVQQADVVVLPSRYNEGVPRCLLEALACGKPIITTNWKGCKETVEHGINGYIIERDDLASLEEFVEWFIRADRDVLRRMGHASRQKAEREFDEQIVITKYLQAIQTPFSAGSQIELNDDPREPLHTSSP